MKERSATFSPDRNYRYTLWRRWLDRRPSLMVIGLNPSTADETKDDPTVRRCICFARDWGFGALCMTNLFAFRATDPNLMKAAPEPIGDANNAALVLTAGQAGLVLAAWAFTVHITGETRKCSSSSVRSRRFTVSGRPPADSLVTRSICRRARSRASIDTASRTIHL